MCAFTLTIQIHMCMLARMYVISTLYHSQRTILGRPLSSCPLPLPGIDHVPGLHKRSPSSLTLRPLLTGALCLVYGSLIHHRRVVRSPVWKSLNFPLSSFAADSKSSFECFISTVILNNYYGCQLLLLFLEATDS